MTLEELYYVAQLVAALAVLATLLVLVRQVRDNSRVMSASVIESAMTGFNELNRMMLEHAEILEEIDRLEDPAYRASPGMMIRIMAFYRLSANHTYKLFRLHKQGVLPKSEWTLVRRASQDVFLMTRASRIFVRRGEPFFKDLWPALGLTAEMLAQDAGPPPA